MSEIYYSEQGIFTRRRVVAGLVVLAGLVGGFRYKTLPDGHRDKESFVSTLSLHDECGEWRVPLLNREFDGVPSCSPFKDTTTQKIVRSAFLYTPVPHSAVLLSRGADGGTYGVGATLSYKQDIPKKVFNKDGDLTLVELESILVPLDAMPGNLVADRNRDMCVRDMLRVVEFVQSQADTFASDTVENTTIGNAQNVYRDAIRGDGSAPTTGVDANGQMVPLPRLFIYDMESGQSPEESIIECWNP